MHQTHLNNRLKTNELLPIENDNQTNKNLKNFIKYLFCPQAFYGQQSNLNWEFFWIYFSIVLRGRNCCPFGHQQKVLDIPNQIKNLTRSFIEGQNENMIKEDCCEKVHGYQKQLTESAFLKRSDVMLYISWSRRLKFWKIRFILWIVFNLFCNEINILAPRYHPLAIPLSWP